MAQAIFHPGAFSGTYVPVLTPVANVDSVTLVGAHYMRIGGVATVQVEVVLDPTGAGTSQFGCSPSDLVADADLSGLAVSVPAAAASGTVEADTVNNRAQVQITVANGAPRDVHFQFMYSIL